MLSFPDNPIAGQSFTDPSGVEWIRDASNTFWSPNTSSGDLQIGPASMTSTGDLGDTVALVPAQPVVDRRHTKVVTGDYTLTEEDLFREILVDSVNPVTVTAYSPSLGGALLSAGMSFMVRQIGLGQVTLADDGTSVLDSPAGLKIAAQYGTAEIFCRDTAPALFIVSGYMAA